MLPKLHNRSISKYLLNNDMLGAIGHVTDIHDKISFVKYWDLNITRFRSLNIDIQHKIANVMGDRWKYLAGICAKSSTNICELTYEIVEHRDDCKSSIPDQWLSLYIIEAIEQVALEELCYILDKRINHASILEVLVVHDRLLRRMIPEKICEFWNALEYASLVKVLISSRGWNVVSQYRRVKPVVEDYLSNVNIDSENIYRLNSSTLDNGIFTSHNTDKEMKVIHVADIDVCYSNTRIEWVSGIELCCHDHCYYIDNREYITYDHMTNGFIERIKQHPYYNIYQQRNKEIKPSDIVNYCRLMYITQPLEDQYMTYNIKLTSYGSIVVNGESYIFQDGRFIPGSDYKIANHTYLGIYDVHRYTTLAHISYSINDHVVIGGRKYKLDENSYIEIVLSDTIVCINKRITICMSDSKLY